MFVADIIWCLVFLCVLLLKWNIYNHYFVTHKLELLFLSLLTWSTCIQTLIVFDTHVWDVRGPCHIECFISLNHDRVYINRERNNVKTNVMCICTNMPDYETYHQFCIFNRSVIFKKYYENKLSDNLVFHQRFIANYGDK